jgi:hypothetical protein
VKVSQALLGFHLPLQLLVMKGVIGVVLYVLTFLMQTVSHVELQFREHQLAFIQMLLAAQMGRLQ